MGDSQLHLVAGAIEPKWRGDEEYELAPSDRRREGGGVEEVGLEQPQPLRRAGDQPTQQPRLRLVPCTPTSTRIRLRFPNHQAGTHERRDPIHSFRLRRVSPFATRGSS